MHGANSVVIFFNWVYTLGFFPIMGVTAVVFFITARDTYYKYRTIILVSFGIAVVIFAVYPLAPPRIMGGLLGFVDTIQLFGPSQDSNGSELFSDNKYAAMPSMHFAWALLISMAWASHPVPMGQSCSDNLPDPNGNRRSSHRQSLLRGCDRSDTTGDGIFLRLPTGTGALQATDAWRAPVA